MTDFNKISQHLNQIRTLENLNNYYDKIFHVGIFFTLEDINEIDRILFEL